MTTDIAPRPLLLTEFLPLIGQALEVDCRPRTARLTLVSAVPSRYPGFTDRPPFVLTFRSAPEMLLIDGIYAMEGPGLRAALIQITPVIAPVGAQPGHYYEAVFT